MPLSHMRPTFADSVVYIQYVCLNFETGTHYFIVAKMGGMVIAVRTYKKLLELTIIIQKDNNNFDLREKRHGTAVTAALR